MSCWRPGHYYLGPEVGICFIFAGLVFDQSLIGLLTLFSAHLIVRWCVPFAHSYFIQCFSKFIIDISFSALAQLFVVFWLSVTPFSWCVAISKI
jgi:hypothetical protein